MMTVKSTRVTRKSSEKEVLELHSFSSLGRIVETRALVLVMGVLLLFGLGCAAVQEDEEVGRVSFVIPSEVHTFDSFPVMVSTSDVVVLGTISAELKGRAVGPADEQLLVRRFEVDVQDVLVGSLGTSRIIVESDELMISFLNDTTWIQPGARSVLFLEKITEKIRGVPIDLPFVYRLTNSQGLYRTLGQNRLETVLEEDAFALRVAAWSLPGLRAQIESAKGQIARGEIESQLHGSPSSR
jgi:hypothetical protein